jgi:ParB family chromosome partitioning protein
MAIRVRPDPAGAKSAAPPPARPDKGPDAALPPLPALVKLPFERLRPGAPAINARAPANGTPELAALVESIAAKGIIEALIVRPAATAGLYEVIAGNRRLAAFGRLVKAKRRSREDLLPCHVVAADDATALDLSTTENIIRLPMHEVDEFEAFARLAEAGRSVAEIASAYAVDERKVRQRLALGRLAPAVRAAWRKGKIGAEHARLFTLAPVALQETVIAAHPGGFGPGAYALRHALGLTDTTRDADFAFVGADAYVAAGGRLRQDLFSDEAFVEDPQILAALVAARVKAACDDLVADGWSWALPEPENAWDYEFHIKEWRRNADAADPAWTPAVKATHGCFVVVENGRLVVTYGVVGAETPTGAAPPTSAADPDVGGAGPQADAPAQSDAAAARPLPAARADALPGALRQKLAALASAALAEAVARDVRLAMTLACATLVTDLNGDPAPAALHADGREDGTLDAEFFNMRGLDFVTAFAQIGAMGALARDRLFAALVGAAVDTVTVEPDAVAVVAAAARKPVLDEILYAHFDPAEYFDQAPKQAALDALAEMGQPAPHAAAKKGAVAAAAATAAAGARWLPPLLRGPHYDGPGAAPKAEAAGAADPASASAA